jgi:multidrug efflux pump
MTEDALLFAAALQKYPFGGRLALFVVPLAVLLAVPLGVIGAVVGANLRGYPNDVYFTVGLVTIIGLSAKNAILIIEFARDLQRQGHDLVDATLQAIRLRMRPIVMTSLAFLMGVLPLALATGAGSAGQRAIGTGVIGGIITATVFALLLVPVFFVAVRRVFKERQPASVVPPKDEVPEPREPGGTR